MNNETPIYGSDVISGTEDKKPNMTKMLYGVYHLRNSKGVGRCEPGTMDGRPKYILTITPNITHTSRIL